MNRQAKSAIKSLVLTLRHRLEEDIAIGLKRYGFAGERWLPIERLPHIERDDAAAADHFRLRAALEQHLRRIGAEPETATPAQRAEAVEWFVREVAFTHLNRLVALKCLEARGLIPEIITTRDAYGGRARAHHEYRFDHPAEAAAPDDALPAAIRHVCRTVYPEFRLLFDVGDPATDRKPPADDIVWPAYPILRDCISLINGLDEAANGRSQMANGRSQLGDSNFQPPTSSLWLEDEIIGWIYQFYNAEQKEAIRDRGAPKRPAEVAVINQFFTPRWIVKFLVDNTLGRLWLEMHPDSPRVRAKCDYLVPEPLAGDSDRGFALDPDSPINNPQAPPRRPAKRPQDIRLIDPACGTMHFGHYAFEVFHEIYLDYYEWYAGGEPARTSNLQPLASNLQSEIPAAILRHNLYGVDIDLRAVQLAALSLFIKAKHALSAVEGTADPNAHITQMNLVVADAVLPADGVRAQFLDRYKDDKAVQDAVRQVLDEMANVAEVGSLLRVEERLRAILEKAGHSAVHDLDPRRQRELPGLEPTSRQIALVELPEAQPEDWGAHYTVARLLDDLREFAARALQTHDLNAQLFAEEAEKSVHLLDVFLNDYDVAVMNPPFGYPVSKTGKLLDLAYPGWCGNLLCAFYLRAKDLCSKSGYVGMVSDKTFAVKKTYEPFRLKHFLSQPGLLTFIDLGWNVLDANVEVCAFVSSQTFSQHRTAFFDLQTVSDKQAVLSRNIGGETANRYWVDSASLRMIPFGAFAYKTPSSVLAAFANLARLDPTAATCPSGGLDAPAEQYYRLHWEISSEKIRRDGDYVPFWNGYTGYSPFYAPIEDVLLWKGDGSVIKRESRSNIRLPEFYFRPGIGWGKRGDILDVCPVKGAVFSKEGQVVFPHDPGQEWPLIAFLNSSLARFSVNLYCGQHKYGSYVGQLPIAPGLFEVSKNHGPAATKAHNLKSAWDNGNETCTRFDAPWLVQARRGTLLRTMDDGKSTIGLDLPGLPTSSFQLPAALDYLLAVEHAADARLQQLQSEIDAAVYDLYEITPEDRALIERELGDRPPELIWPQMAGKSDDEKRREHVRRLVSWCVLNALKEKRDGILPVTPVAGEVSAVDAVRRGLEAEFGEAAAFRLESDIGQVLGQPLADWLDGPFVRWHTPLYKRRPIIWHLASPKNAFGCFVYLHKLDGDTLRKVQTLYLWPRRRGIEAARDEARRALTAGDRSASRRLEAAEALLDDLAEFEKRLLSVIQAQVKCAIPEWAEGPFRNGVYDPVLDDGVKVNLTPLQEAGVLRYGKVV